MSDLDPLDPSLAELFRAEPATAPPRGAQARVAERLLLAIPAVHAAPHGGSASALGHAVGARLVGALAAAFFAGGVVGGVAVAILRPPPPARVVYVDRPAPSAVSAPSPVPAPPPSARETAPPSTASSTASEPPPPSPDRDELAAERGIVDDARGRLTSGNAAGALERLRDHGRRYPRGRLAEEREALIVEALVQLGRYDEARARAAQLRARWPNSVLLPAVDATLQSIP